MSERLGTEVSSSTGLRTESELGQEMGWEQDPEEVAELRSELHQSTGENIGTMRCNQCHPVF